MYKDRFVLSVVSGGYVVRESSNGVVNLPFGTEYKIRLKNKNDCRCQAVVSIDGALVCHSRFVIGSNSSVDIERFVLDSLGKGNRFKFVSVDDSRVADKYNEEDNGVIKVEFYKELTWALTYSSYGPPVQVPYYWTDDSWVNAGVRSSKTISNNFVNNATAEVNCFVTDNTSGATVEGGNSDQHFGLVDGFAVETFPTILELKLKSPTYMSDRVIQNHDSHSRYCSRCGKKVKKFDIYCSKCGAYLVGS